MVEESEQEAEEEEKEKGDDSFFIIREICIWSFKNSVNPVVGSGERKKKN